MNYDEVMERCDGDEDYDVDNAMRMTMKTTMTMQQGPTQHP